MGKTENGAGLSVAAVFDQGVQSVVGENTPAISEMSQWQDKQKIRDGFIEASISNLDHWNEQLGAMNDTVQRMKQPTVQQLVPMTAL
jgi:hypothetical protein